MYLPSKSLHQTTTALAEISLRYSCCIPCMTYLHSLCRLHTLRAPFLPSYFGPDAPEAVVTSSEPSMAAGPYDGHS